MTTLSPKEVAQAYLEAHHRTGKPVTWARGCEISLVDPIQGEFRYAPGPGGAGIITPMRYSDAEVYPFHVSVDSQSTLVVLNRVMNSNAG